MIRPFRRIGLHRSIRQRSRTERSNRIDGENHVITFAERRFCANRRSIPAPDFWRLYEMAKRISSIYPILVFEPTFDPSSGNALAKAVPHSGRTRKMLRSTQIVRIWRIGDGSEICESRLPDLGLETGRFDAEGKRLITTCSNKSLRILDVASGAEVFRIWGNTHYVKTLEFSPDGERIVTGSWAHAVKIWDAAPFARKETRFRAEAAEAAPQ